MVFSSSALYASTIRYEMEGVKSWSSGVENALALREFEIEPTQGETRAGMESLGLQNDRVRGLLQAVKNDVGV